MPNLEVLEERLKNMDEKLDQLVHSVIGNGKPGLLLRVDRLEQSERLKNKVIWLLFSLVVGLGVNTAYGWIVNVNSATQNTAVQQKR